jgi:cytoskeletal protein CcmA (bactofilin family)
MKRRLTLIILILFALLASGCVAQVVTSGNYTLRSGETLRGDLVVFSGQVTLEEGSRVTGSVIMTSGDLYVEADAQIEGNVAMTSGDVYLRPGAVVRGDVIGTSGDVHRAEGARVEGQVSTDASGFSVSGAFIADLIGTYCVLPVVVIGVLFYLLASLGRRRPAVVEQGPAVSEDPTQKLKQLQEMMERGLITEADYEAKKAEILSRM